MTTRPPIPAHPRLGTRLASQGRTADLRLLHRPEAGVHLLVAGNEQAVPGLLDEAGIGAGRTVQDAAQQDRAGHGR